MALHDATPVCDPTDCSHTYVGGPAALVEHLRQVGEYWQSEWAAKNAEAKWFRRRCVLLSVLCGVQFGLVLFLGLAL